ncbi:hypothetical protein [Oceaniradius stylonematis]|uniref:hypothetical protein n=1 Tax=Oceaniradius stylonematis TaxID=2184161 RepID=UPI003C7D7040
MSEESIKRVLGVADYDAYWIGKSLLVRLTAHGLLPCFNYTAQLEQRPERVSPPNWNMVFYTPDVCMTALRPFEVSVVMSNVGGASSLRVFDATGENEVKIRHESDREQTTNLQSALEKDQFVVHARVPKGASGHHGCIVVPADMVVSAIYYRAYGPASKADCDAFVAKNCDVSITAGGEIPWPMLTDEQ